MVLNDITIVYNDLQMDVLFINIVIQSQHLGLGLSDFLEFLFSYSSAIHFSRNVFPKDFYS